MVRTQLYIFTQNSTLGIQLHVSALYIGHMCVGYPTHIRHSRLLSLQYNLTMANIQGRNM